MGRHTDLIEAAKENDFTKILVRSPPFSLAPYQHFPYHRPCQSVQPPLSYMFQLYIYLFSFLFPKKGTAYRQAQVPGVFNQEKEEEDCAGICSISL